MQCIFIHSVVILTTKDDGEEKLQREKPLPRIFDGKYFEIINVEKNDKVLATCKHCKQGDIRRISLEGLEKRFEEELKISGAASDKIIAAIWHPYFKLRCILTDDKKRKMP